MFCAAGVDEALVREVFEPDDRKTKLAELPRFTPMKPIDGPDPITVSNKVDLLRINILAGTAPDLENDVSTNEPSLAPV
jgi:hypothetical protein